MGILPWLPHVRHSTANITLVQLYLQLPQNRDSDTDRERERESERERERESERENLRILGSNLFHDARKMTLPLKIRSVSEHDRRNR